ncbi:MAG TPA: hypothetical protein DEB17_11225 [Chlorobaculum sp.]|uniref:Uncharacterized protein n=1 Tax=Chlorobaculum tepidum (strain ATCC 49652 / DSM 12025 / NBRC 103806 / TLS) TaxID=194439 RepID=Q8KCN9_CHLTE|nr:hypothetical protein CT1374 [Chlorobaculum tepidum TLS]HBU24539.1 hypothetical protein [Chlorobaculum sp.]
MLKANDEIDFCMIHYDTGLEIKKKQKSTSMEGACLVFKIISKQQTGKFLNSDHRAHENLA